MPGPAVRTLCHNSLNAHNLEAHPVWSLPSQVRKPKLRDEGRCARAAVGGAGCEPQWAAPPFQSLLSCFCAMPVVAMVVTTATNELTVVISAHVMFMWPCRPVYLYGNGYIPGGEKGLGGSSVWNFPLKFPFFLF